MTSTPTPGPSAQDDEDDAAWDALMADPDNLRAQEELARAAAESARSGALGLPRPMEGPEDPLVDVGKG